MEPNLKLSEGDDVYFSGEIPQSHRERWSHWAQESRYEDDAEMTEPLFRIDFTEIRSVDD